MSSIDGLKYFWLASRKKHMLKSFMKRGAKPWTSGYELYKWDSIERVITSGASFYDLLGTEQFGWRIDERIVEYGWFFEKLRLEPSVMLDAGSALNHNTIIVQEKLRNKKLFISTLAPERIAFLDRGISYVFEDLRFTCFREKMFDCIVCISTIEHVGLDNTLLYTCEPDKNENRPEEYLPFVDVLHALLKPGGSLYLTFPFGKAKNHGWFQVFDSRMISALLDRFRPEHHTEEIFQYSGERWHLSSREEAKEATCFDINVQKTYDSDYAAFSRSVACLELVR